MPSSDLTTKEINEWKKVLSKLTIVFVTVKTSPAAWLYNSYIDRSFPLLYQLLYCLGISVERKQIIMLLTNQCFSSQIINEKSFKWPTIDSVCVWLTFALFTVFALLLLMNSSIYSSACSMLSDTVKKEYFPRDFSSSFRFIGFSFYVHCTCIHAQRSENIEMRRCNWNCVAIHFVFFSLMAAFSVDFFTFFQYFLRIPLHITTPLNCTML